MPARFTGLFARFWKDQKGATAIEYGFIAVLISLAGIAAFGAVGDSLSNMYLTLNSNIVSVIP